MSSTNDTPSSGARSHNSTPSKKGTPQKQQPSPSQPTPTKIGHSASTANSPQHGDSPGYRGYYTPLEGRTGSPAASEPSAFDGPYSPTPTDRSVMSAPAELGTQPPRGPNPGLYAPAFPMNDPNKREGLRDVETILTKIRNPPVECWSEDRTRVTLGWHHFMSMIGAENFRNEPYSGHRVLDPDSEVYERGLRGEVATPLFDWLCGDPPRDVMEFDASHFEQKPW